MSINSLVIGMTHLEGPYEQIDKRLGAIEARMDSRFHWVLGLPIISTLVPIAFRMSGR